MATDYEHHTYIQTLRDGTKRLVISLYKIEKKLVKQYFVNIEEEEFYKDGGRHVE